MERKYKSGALKHKGEKKNLIASCVPVSSYFLSFQHNCGCNDGMMEQFENQFSNFEEMDTQFMVLNPKHFRACTFLVRRHLQTRRSSGRVLYIAF